MKEGRGSLQSVWSKVRREHRVSHKDSFVKIGCEESTKILLEIQSKCNRDSSIFVLDKIEISR
jgi:hypothetical protein